MTRRIRLLAIVSWIAGAASLLPFTTDWFDLSVQAANFLLLGTLATAAALGVLMATWSALRDVLVRLAGSADEPAEALALVAVVAGASALAMLGCSALVGLL